MSHSRKHLGCHHWVVGGIGGRTIAMDHGGSLGMSDVLVHSIITRPYRTTKMFSVWLQQKFNKDLKQRTRVAMASYLGPKHSKRCFQK